MNPPTLGNTLDAEYVKVNVITHSEALYGPKANLVSGLYILGRLVR